MTSNFVFLGKPTESVGRMQPLLHLKPPVSSISAGPSRPDLKHGVSLRSYSERQEQLCDILLPLMLRLNIT